MWQRVYPLHCRNSEMGFLSQTQPVGFGGEQGFVLYFPGGCLVLGSAHILSAYGSVGGHRSCVAAFCEMHLSSHSTVRGRATSLQHTRTRTKRH